MAVYSGPETVSSGLLLHLDSASTKSYAGTGAIWYDVSGKGRHATLVNSPTYDTSYNGCLSMNNTLDQYATIPHDSTISSQVFGTSTTFTLSCWVNTSAFRNWTCMVGKMVGASYSNTTAGLWSTSTGYEVVIGSNENNNPTGSFLILSMAASTNKWYNIVGVGDGTQLLMYSNGVLVRSGSISSVTRTRSENTSQIVLGKRIASTVPSHTGLLADIMVYNRGLTYQEVLQNFEATRGRYGV